MPQNLSDSYQKLRSAENSRQNTPVKSRTKKAFGKRPSTASPTGEPVKPLCAKHFIAREKEYGLAQVSMTYLLYTWYKTIFTIGFHSLHVEKLFNIAMVLSTGL